MTSSHITADVLQRTGIFEQFSLQEPRRLQGFFLDALGGRTRAEYYGQGFERAQEANGIFGDILDLFKPGPTEDYFAWVDLLESVSQARNSFTMFELGAGFGRWLIHGACALRQRGLTNIHLVGVEAEPTHYKWMIQHFLDNGLNPKNHSLIEGAVAGQDGTTCFYAGCPGEWYGQSVAPHLNKATTLLERLKRQFRNKSEKPMDTVIRTKVTSLKTLLDYYDFVDFIHMDIQGSELVAVHSAMNLLDSKVRKVHIATHDKYTAGTSGQDVEPQLATIFGALGWENVNNYPSRYTVESAIGTFKLNDGIQTWLNPKFA